MNSTVVVVVVVVPVATSPMDPSTPPPGPRPRGTPPEKVMDSILTSSLEKSKSTEKHAKTQRMVVLLYDP